jgi:DNA-binding IclR family transcriptional regulator
VLTQGPGGRKLSLGPAIAELAFAHWDEEGAANLAQPILNDFRDTINETVILGIRIRNRVLIIATAEASEFLKISALIGSTIPLLGGAVGKVLLSQESLDNAAQLLEKYGLRRYTDQSIIDAQDYMQELERVRKQGYALDFDEYIRGIRAVAVALNNRTGLPAALWVVGISARMDAEKMQKIAQLAKEKALELRSVIDQNSPRTN